MASRKFKWTAAGAAVATIGLTLVGYNLIAAQGQGTLAQEPLATKVNSTPAFIMAVDDSGSMNFQTQFPGMDGEGCWNTTRRSFFDANGQLYTDGTCDYFFVLPGPRINNYSGIPPLDSLGFARSAAYNPTYYDPRVKYEPWMENGTTAMAQSNPGAARIDPKPNGSLTTVNLASDYYSINNDDSFRMQTGMVVQAGTTVRNNNNGNTTVFNNEGTWTGGNTVVSIRYWPATFYVPYTSNADAYPELAGTTGAYTGMTRLRVANACGTGCAMWKYTITTANPVALNNFANWFTYYGNRNRAMIAGMTRSLSGVNDLTVGYFRINQHGSYDSGTAANKRLTMRLMSEPDQKNALYKEMLALTASGGTPNRQAVNAAALQFTRTDTGAPIADSCQKNAVMLFTDGFSNGGGPTVGNTDGNMGNPFSDGNSDTMADIVTRFYVNNGAQPPLRPDLAAGKVPVPEACKAGTDKSLDCQTNLHLNFYGVTLGARGNLFNPDLQQNPYTDASIYGNWPPRQDDQRSTVDDIWHAAVNTRGEYINARTPVDITNAMSRVLSAVGSGGAPAGGTGASGARIGAGSLSVGSEYDVKNEGTDWSARLSATRLSVDPTTRAVVQTAFWEASTQLQAAASRRIFFTKGGTTREFTGNNATLADLCTKPAQYAGMSLCSATDLTLQTGAIAATAVNYLRGDTTLEKRNGGTMRDRTTRLGDIINSTAVVTSPIDDYGYRRLGGTLESTYATFLANKAAVGTYMVYVGANDGMLHGFNGGMNAAGNVVAGGGTEAFGYIPSTALGHMGNLLYPYNASSKTGQKMQHRYYVDGQISVGDTNYGGAWHTTLVGASGAGGRSVFGLDVTHGTTFAAGSKLWEISDLDTNLPQAVRDNIGHVMGKPVIVPVLNAAGTPSWKAIFGNGFNSASGKAVLYVVDIATGAATMLEAVETGTGVPSGSNGLGSIVVIDRWGGTGQTVRSRDGYSDTVYGTDQKGAVWKFDLRNLGNLSRPLFTTRSYTEGGLTLRQPITGGITAGTGNNGGVMVYFGTGSFIFTEDPKDSSLQTLYAVNDLVDGAITTTLTRANLNGSTAGIAGTLRTLTSNTTPTNARGWFIDLAYRERFVGTPSLSNGIVYMPTYVPRDLATTTDCAVPGDNWLFGLQPLNGSGALGRATLGSPGGTGFAIGTAGFKSSTKGGSPITNANAFALPRQSPPALGGGGSPGGPGTPGGGGGGGGPPEVPPSVCMGGVQYGSETLYIPYPCGRQSWRQIQ